MIGGREVEVILNGSPSVFSRKGASFYKDLAKEYGLVYEGEMIAGLLHKQDYKSDMIHLNQEGYRKMAAAIYQLLVESGAL